MNQPQVPQQVQYVQEVYAPQEVTYFTKPMGFLKRIFTGNVVGASKQLEYITFRDQDFDVKTRDGALNTFRYDQVTVTESIIGRVYTISPTIKCNVTGRKVKLHVCTDNEEITTQEGEYILQTLQPKKRLLT
jgi:hypothetical protein